MRTKTTDLALGRQQASLERHLDSGQYEDASEVMRDALRALDRENAVLDEVLRDKVKASMADRRSSVPASDVFRRLQARHARKVRTDSRGA